MSLPQLGVGSLGDATAAVDDASAGAPAYYLANSAHPTHVAPALDAGGAWLPRLRAARTNASVRRADARDWPAVAALLHEYSAWMYQQAGFDPFAVQPAFVEELADLAGHYAHPDNTMFVAVAHQPVAGSIAIVCHPDGDAELKRMYVTPAARGRGLADALVDEAVSHATARNCRSVWLESVPGPMDAAIAVYSRNGFVPVDRTPTIEVAGTFVMRRSLNASG